MILRRKSKKEMPLWKRIILSIVVISILAVLSFFVVSVSRVTSSAMAPTLQPGDVIVSMRWYKTEPGDLVTLSHDDETLVRRVIATQGDAVQLDTDGTVFVNGEALDEPYVEYKVTDYFEDTIYAQVSADRYYVLSDNRENLADSRSTAIGALSSKQMTGKVLCCIWPLNHITLF